MATIKQGKKRGEKEETRPLVKLQGPKKKVIFRAITKESHLLHTGKGKGEFRDQRELVLRQEK